MNEIRRRIQKEFLDCNKNIKEESLLWRADGRLEWQCKHGIGHTVYSPDFYYVHGCDDCCKQINIPKDWLINKSEKHEEMDIETATTF